MQIFNDKNATTLECTELVRYQMHKVAPNCLKLSQCLLIESGRTAVGLLPEFNEDESSKSCIKLEDKSTSYWIRGSDAVHPDCTACVRSSVCGRAENISSMHKDMMEILRLFLSSGT